MDKTRRSRAAQLESQNQYSYFGHICSRLLDQHLYPATTPAMAAQQGPSATAATTTTPAPSTSSPDTLTSASTDPAPAPRLRNRATVSGTTKTGTYAGEDTATILERFDSGHNQMFPDDPRDVRHFDAMNTKSASKFYDPCKLTAQMSLNCLARSRYNQKRAKEECKEYFEAYQECKSEWRSSRRERM
ncbi:uncharacterized protein V1518DRAFT_413935 [Limtongia smithiae]|uniref:uncharacterized protein n=1 Tax=Limtongia smithiae TaxID=1125753 RepID=UPI0034CEDD84